ncbi:MAG: malto-oligosyltrehalose trehalohydrolase [Acidobacteriota bacterium]
MHRACPVGAEIQPAGVHFRVWAPNHLRVEIQIETDPPIALRSEGNGYFEGLIQGSVAGDRYRITVDDSSPLPDPASRFQPDGPHGPSAVVAPGTYRWTDDGWPGIRRSELVVYEIHIGTFTADGTWQAAARELAALAELGVTCVEIMPVADFAGDFGWGYDGVNLFAPTRLYGAPDDFRDFVDTAHHLGIGVILDVVYNHFGPDGCYLAPFTRAYFGDDGNEWGQGINFDGPLSAGVREFFVSNAAYWIREFHLDGLRIDATQAIHDRSTPHILAEVTAAVRQAADGRATWVVGESEPQDSELTSSIDTGGQGLDALWNDDLHHAAMVAATGRREAYYTDYAGSPQEFISAAKYGFLYQGQWYSWQDKGRGTPALRHPADAFVAFLQNHDQIANSSHGFRLHDVTSAGKLRALTALLLLGPWVPMLFQGQEFAAPVPFLYFADHGGGLADLIRAGRRDFLGQFPSVADAVRSGIMSDPCDRDTFERCKLRRDETPERSAIRALHASLLQLRTSEAAFRMHDRHDIDGAVLGPQAFVLRFFERSAERFENDRLLLVNLGGQLDMNIVPEPLLAAPAGHRWSTIWSSDDPAFGGPGVFPVVRLGGWCLPPEGAVVLAPQAGAWRPS